MPFRPRRVLKSSIDAYGQRSTFCPFTLNSDVMLPADGISVTTIWFFASSSWMVSPLRRAAYCADAGSVVAIRKRIANTKDRFIFLLLFRQREAVERVAGRHRHVLAAVNRVGHGRCRHVLPRLKMP